MKKENHIYLLLCVLGGGFLGYFARELDTTLGVLLFMVGLFFIIVSIIMASK